MSELLGNSQEENMEEFGKPVICYKGAGECVYYDAPGAIRCEFPYWDFLHEGFIATAGTSPYAQDVVDSSGYAREHGLKEGEDRKFELIRVGNGYKTFDAILAKCQRHFPAGTFSGLKARDAVGLAMLLDNAILDAIRLDHVIVPHEPIHVQGKDYVLGVWNGEKRIRAYEIDDLGRLEVPEDAAFVLAVPGDEK